MKLFALFALGLQRNSFDASRRATFMRSSAMTPAPSSSVTASALRPDTSSKPLSVAFLVNDFPLLSESFVINQAVGLIERGHTVDIYTLHNLQPGESAVKHRDVERHRLLDRTHYAITIPEDRSLRVLKALALLVANFRQNPRFCWRWCKSILLGGGKNLWRLLYIAAPLLRRSHDIVHCQFGAIGLTGLALHRLGAIRGKLITTFRGFDISQGVRTRGDRVYRELFKTDARFITNCMFFERRLLKLGCDPARLTVLPSGIDCTKFTPAERVGGRRDNQFRLVTIGRLVEKKGIEYALRAIARLADAHPDIEVRYTIVGDGPLCEPLQRLIEELRISHVVSMLSWRNH